MRIKPPTKKLSISPIPTSPRRGEWSERLREMRPMSISVRIAHYACFCVLIGLSAISCSSIHPSDSDIQIDKPLAQKAVDSPSQFILGVGDELSINVWRHDTLGRSISIDPAGNITLPLVGDIQATGLTPIELRDTIAARLSTYIVNPRVDVNVKVVKSKQVYVLGEVTTPGIIVLDHQILFWEAIAKSGGFTNDANQKTVLLIREDKNMVRVSVLNLDIIEQISNRLMERPIYLRDRDIIYVPRSVISNIEKFMTRLNNIISPIVSIENAIIFEPEVINALKGNTTNSNIYVPR